MERRRLSNRGRINDSAGYVIAQSASMAATEAMFTLCHGNTSIRNVTPVQIALAMESPSSTVRQILPAISLPVAPIATALVG